MRGSAQKPPQLKCVKPYFIANKNFLKLVIIQIKGGALSTAFYFFLEWMIIEHCLFTILPHYYCSEGLK